MALAIMKEPNIAASTSQQQQSTGATSTWEASARIFRDAPWRDFAKSPGVWAMLLAHCSKNWGLYNTLAWTPTFYAEQYGIGVRDSAWLSVLPSVAGAAGGLLAGNVADALIRYYSSRGEMSELTLTNVRKLFQSVALFGPALALGILAMDIPADPVVAQSFLMVAVGLQAFTASGFESANQEKAGEKWAGLLYSVTSLPAVMVGTAGVYTVGQILDATGQDWSVVFGINAIVNILGGTAFVALYNSKREFD
jgi:sugar phosphate permease